jgi:hypothetical protein
MIDFSLIHEHRTVVWQNLQITGVCLKVFRPKYGLFLELLGTCYIHNAHMYTNTMSILYFSSPKKSTYTLPFLYRNKWHSPLLCHAVLRHHVLLG